MNGVLQDLRYALRQLRKSPGFTFCGLAVLALGIGATTGMLAVVQSVLLRPLNYNHPERLVLVGTTGQADSTSNVTFRNFEELRSNLRSFAELGAYSSVPVAVETDAGAQMLVAPAVTANFFKMLGVEPVMGRSFQQGDDAPGANIAIVSYPFWRDTLHGDKNILGKKIKIGGDLYAIVGVMPSHFQFPQRQESLWTALQLSPEGKTKQGFDELSVVGKLRPGVSLDQARAEGEAFLRHNAMGTSNGEALHFWVYPYQSLVTGSERPAILALLAACFLLLLIAVVNTANLQIARATKRDAEIAMRSALGATRSRLLRQLVTESLLLSFAGATAGWLVAIGFVRSARYLFEGYARFDEIRLDSWTFAGCVLLTFLCGVAAALAPARHLLHNKSELLQNSTGRYSRSQRLTGVLVASEVALTCILLVATGLFLKTFRSLQEVPLGISPNNVTGFVLWPQEGNVSTQVATSALERILARLEHLPNVESAGMATSLPISNFQITITSGFSIPGYLAPAEKNPPQVRLEAVSADYFHALRISLLQGRFISSSDVGPAHPVGVVNRTLAERFLHGLDPVGKQIVLDKDAEFPIPITIVGVFQDVVQGNGIGEAIQPEVLLSFRQLPASSPLPHFLVAWAPSFAVRTKGVPATIAQDIRSVIKTEAPEFATQDIVSMDEALRNQFRERRLTLQITSAFAWIALLLSAAGLYGVLSYLVAQRIREIGIRLALGATRQDVFALIARQGLVMVGTGIVAGWFGAVVAGRWIRSFLFDTTPHDVMTYAVVGALIVVASAIAISLPARRAAKIDPMIALRYE
jgi:putative ABC transport system permease protein